MRPTLAALLCASLALPLAATADVSDPGWSETVVSMDGNSHTGLGWAPDGSDRLFVLEKGGRVRMMSGALGGTPVWSTFATLSPVYTNSECGLIGLAFDPDYVSNRYVYFFVTVGPGEQQIIRFRDDGGTGVEQTVILAGLPTAGQNHDGGGIGFAADGKLYWSIGDLGNGSGVDADLTSLAAKVGRANRDGSLPDGNPFADGDGPNNDYIFARGMRNPFTMQIQPSTGDLWLNVVGTGYEQIFVVGAGDHGGYNDYENNQPLPGDPGYDQHITPRIVYRTNGSDTRTFAAATPPVRSGGIATFTTVADHRFRVGGNITIENVADASFNGPDQYIASITGPRSFTVLQPGPDAASSGGQAVTLNQGGSLTGGVFFDSTAAPSEYRGNFFYGDFNSGQIMRARLDALTNQVRRVDLWASNLGGQVDLDIGPDGALYAVRHTNNRVHRFGYAATAQALVVSKLNLRMDEDGEAAFAVSLAQAPAGDVTVSVARSSGDTDVGVIAGSSLLFTPANWRIPQAVRLAAAPDGDTDNDEAIVTVSASGLDSVPVAVHVLDLLEGLPQANLSISVSDGTDDVVPGGSTTYTIVAHNAGPAAASGAIVADAFPSALSCDWVCVGSGGGACTAGGSGDIDDVVALAAGGSTTYTATCAIDAGASGVLENTASITAPASVTDPDLDDNIDTDSNTLFGLQVFTDGFED